MAAITPTPTPRPGAQTAGDHDHLAPAWYIPAVGAAVPVPPEHRVAICASSVVYTPLRGLERMYGGVSAFYTIASTFHFRATEDALEHLQSQGIRALSEVMHTHPRMRATIISDLAAAAAMGLPPGTAYFRIEPRLTEERVARCFRVVTPTAANGPRWWEHVVYERINTVFDRNDPDHGSMFEIILVRPAPGSDVGQLIVASDHSASDGMSGSIICNDFLTAAFRDPPTAAAMKSAPLRVSAMGLVFGPADGNWLTRTVSSTVVSVAASSIIDAYQNFRSVLPLHDGLPEMDRLPFPRSTSWGMFALGRAENLTQSIRRCREENVTLFGALTASVVAAFSRAALRPAEPGCMGGKPERVSFLLDADFNLRTRVTPSLGDTTVGLSIGFATLERLAKGIELGTRFWDLARTLKTDVDTKIQGIEAGLLHRYVDNAYKRPEEVLKTFRRVRKGAVSDVNFSNIGRYPFATRFRVSGGEGSLELIGHNLINGCSGLTNATILFISACNGVPGYSVAYKTEHEPTRRWFATVVRCWEAIGSVGTAETISEFAARVCNFDDAVEPEVAPYDTALIDAAPSSQVGAPTPSTAGAVAAGAAVAVPPVA